jgi:hypothetical protein
MSRRRLLLVLLPSVLVLTLMVPGCTSTQSARDARDAAERSKMESLGLRMQKVRQAMNDEIAKQPAKAREIAAKYAKAIEYLDEEAATLPDPLREEFARKYGKK